VSRHAALLKTLALAEPWSNDSFKSPLPDLPDFFQARRQRPPLLCLRKEAPFAVC
jgi:hypothetical protein